MHWNDSSNSSESDSEAHSAFTQTEHNIVAAYLITAGVVSIFSNIVVLGIFVKYKELRTATNAIIINLAFTDIGVSGIGYPMSAASDLHGSWKFGYTGCQIYAALNIFFGMASIGLLTVVAVDRYLTICRPDIGRRMTSRSYATLILAAWINAVFWASMPTVGWASYAPDPTGATCTVNWRKNDVSFVSYTMSVIAVNFVVPLTVMFYCYYNVSRTMKQYASSNCLESINVDWSDQVDVTKMSVVMIVMFLMAWSPYSIVCLWSSFGDPKKISPAMAIIAPLFAKSSTFYNPCIYVIANKKFRRAILAMVRCQTRQEITINNALPMSFCWEEAMYLFVYFYLLMNFLEEVHGFCPSQCTCVYHGRSDGTGTRSVLCNDPDMYEIPVNVPVDTVKLRIEKTVIRRIPTEAFYYLVDLKYLWVTYNCVANIDISSFYNLKQLHELRLDGNLLSTFPWESLAEMPNLRILDLHNNKVTSIPADAGRYLRNLTYLDISSNKLTTLPSDLMDIWPPFSEALLPKNTDVLVTQRVILGLQDNPWFCDCRISKLIEFSKIVDNSVVLLDPLVSCSGPESLAGILFQRAELEQCLKPSVMTSATKITSPLGSNVLLRCDATGYPTPQLTWTRSDNIPVNYTVIQETPGEGVRWSIISLTGISYKDAGEYRCKAKNLAGMSEAAVAVTVVGVITTTVSPQKYVRKQEAEGQNTTREESKQEPEQTTIPLLTTATTTALVSTERSTSIRLTDKKQSRPVLDGKKNPKAVTNGNKKQTGEVSKKGEETKQTGEVSKKGEETSLNTAGMDEQNVTVKNLRVISETDERVTLTWKTVNATSNSAVTVLYSKYGEKDMLPLSTDSSKNKVTIDGLQPSTQYMACVSPKGVPPTKEQCIIFSTDGLNNEESSQFSILILASSAACVVVLPLILFLLYKVLKLHVKPKTAKEAELAKETYVKFETLSLKPRTVNTGEQLWARRYTDESERLLLCSRSSMDSQMTFKSEGSRSEYLC